MIAKKVVRKKGSESSHERLVKYLLSEKSLEKGERLVDVRATNCNMGHNIDIALMEIEATQSLNQMIKSDKTYHLILSFQPEDPVTKEIIKEMEESFCQTLGFGEHQRISVVHGDTNNLHVHIAINKIHPDTLNIHEPFQDMVRMRQLCFDMEKKYGLLPNPVGHDVEKKAITRDGFKSFDSWLIENVGKELVKTVAEVSSWQELQKVAAKFDVEFRKSGAGLAISHKSEKLFVKASSIDKELSFKNLVEKFGEFDESSRGVAVEVEMSYKKAPIAKDSQELWSTYLSYKNDQKETRNKAWEVLKAEKTEAMDKLNEIITNKKIVVKVSKNLGFLDKKIERSKIAAEYLYKKNEVNKFFSEKSKKLSDDYKTLDWSEWLYERSNRGDLEATKALQKVKKRDPLKKDEALVTSRGTYEAKDYLAEVRYDIKRNGNIHYKLGDSVIIDQGNGIRISRGASKEAIEFAVDLAKKRFGKDLKVEGNKELCVEINKKIQKGLER